MEKNIFEELEGLNYWDKGFTALCIFASIAIILRAWYYLQEEILGTRSRPFRYNAFLYAFSRIFLGLAAFFSLGVLSLQFIDFIYLGGELVNEATIVFAVLMVFVFLDDKDIFLKYYAKLGLIMVLTIFLAVFSSNLDPGVKLVALILPSLLLLAFIIRFAIFKLKNDEKELYES
jgi:hypothetical protein